MLTLKAEHVSLAVNGKSGLHDRAMNIYPEDGHKLAGKAPTAWNGLLTVQTFYYDLHDSLTAKVPNYVRQKRERSNIAVVTLQAFLHCFLYNKSSMPLLRQLYVALST